MADYQFSPFSLQMNRLKNPQFIPRSMQSYPVQLGDLWMERKKEGKLQTVLTWRQEQFQDLF